MALSTAFWQTDYDDVRLRPDFTSGPAYTTNTVGADHGDGTWQYWSAVYKVYNLTIPGAVNGRRAIQGTYEDGWFTLGWSAGVTIPLRVDFIRGAAITPSGYSIAGRVGAQQELRFPFFTSHADTDLDNIVSSVRSAPGATALSDFYVFQAASWYGTVAEVIAALIRWAGVEYADLADSVDIDSFSDADDGQRIYGAGENETIKVFYKREIGQDVLSAMMALAIHSHDLFTIRLNGKLALFSNNNDGPHTLPSLDRTDGLVVAQWDSTIEHVTNLVRAGHGHWIDTVQVGFYYNQIVPKPDPRGNSGTDGWPWKEFKVQDSIDRYGEIEARTANVKVMHDQEETSISIFNLPHIAPLYFTLDPDEYARDAVTLLMGRIETEAWPRRVIQITQDGRGLDFDCGWTVENVSVTRDGVTIPRARCIRKTVDFNTMSVTSTLLADAEPEL